MGLYSYINVYLVLSEGDGGREHEVDVRKRLIQSVPWSPFVLFPHVLGRLQTYYVTQLTTPARKITIPVTLLQDSCKNLIA